MFTDIRIFLIYERQKSSNKTELNEYMRFIKITNEITSPRSCSLYSEIRNMQKRPKA